MAQSWRGIGQTKAKGRTRLHNYNPRLYRAAGQMICSERPAEAATNDYVRFPSHYLNLALSSHDGNFKILIGNKAS
jgi:hypothetical protein